MVILRILFLDIDGVMNCAEDIHRQICLTGKITCNEDYNFSPKALACLKEIIDRTGALIVISSSWRISEGLFEEWEKFDRPSLKGRFEAWDKLIDNLNTVSLAEKIIDVTPTDPRLTTREEEIAKWLEDNKELSIESFVILDDENDVGQYADRLVLTSYIQGLTERERELAIKLLGE